MRKGKAGQRIQLAINIRDWYELPSDCRGDGYDIADARHVDDRPRIEVHGDRVIWRTEVRTGARWQDAVFCGYHAHELMLDGGLRRAIIQGARIAVQWVSHCKGAWQWARTRGHYRVAIVDPALHHESIRHRGYLGTLYDGPQCTHDYAGGVWGYSESSRIAATVATAVAQLFDRALAEAAAA